MIFSRANILGIPVLVLACFSLTEGSTLQPKSKRQIYREQVLPSRGGKIPDGAFRTDRLALNRLNKEGISVPDGVLLEHRNVHNHPHLNQHDPEDEDSLVKIIQKSEDRYVPSPGKYHNTQPLTVASTYIIRKPIGPESTALRTPNQQVPYYPHHPIKSHRVIGSNSNGVFLQQQQQVVKQLPTQFSVGLTGSQNAYLPPVPQQYKPVSPPSNKYLPAAPATQNYQPVNVRFPEKNFFSQQELKPTIVHHPHPYGYDAPVSYQSVSYYPIIKTLELPNKDVLRDDYLRVKELRQPHGSSENIHETSEWPSLLEHYTQVSNKINTINHNSFGSTGSHSQFFTPEVLGPIDSVSDYYSAGSGRYARKSKEVSFGSGSKDPNEGQPEQLDKLKCPSGLENTVEDGASPCGK